jgi:predicted nucleic acid-binding protein
VPEPEALESEFRARSHLTSSSPKVWADAYLLAFADVARLKLITFDRALKSRSAEVVLL